MLDKIDRVQDLLGYMDQNIIYGYLTKDGEVVRYDDPNFEDDWFNKYVLSSALDVDNNKVGNCFDQVEFEREWFIRHGYNVKTFFEFVNVPYDNEYETHAFLAYEDDGKWYYFENADFFNRGIYKYDSLDDLLLDTYNRYLKNLEKYRLNENEISLIEVIEYDKPKEHSSFAEFFDFITKNKDVKRIK